MARVVVEGMPPGALDDDAELAGAGAVVVMLCRRRSSKARRRKRKERFVFQMCFAGLLLGLATGLKSVAREAGFGESSSTMEDEGQKWGQRHILQHDYENSMLFAETEVEKNCTEPDQKSCFVL